MTVYAIRMVKEGRTLVRRQVGEGMGRSNAVLIKAQAGVSYLLNDAVDAKGSAPGKLSFKRVGKNLHLALAGTNLEVPDVIIEGYFDFPVAPVLGVLANGSIASYDLGNVVSASQATTSEPDQALASSNSMQTSPASNAYSSVLPGAEEGLPVWAWPVGLLAGAAALKGGGSGGASISAADKEQTALNKVKAYADDSQQTAPELADYQAAGVTGVTAGNLAAMNSAVDALTGTQVDSKAKIQTVVDAYARILAEANGTAVDGTAYNPLVSDYQAIGANIGLAESSTAALTLLNEVVGSLTSAGVDSIAEINALAVVTNKIINLAAGLSPSSVLTLADVALIGLPTHGATGINANNLNAVVAALGSSGGSSKVDTLPELLEFTGAVATILNYAADNTLTAPTLAQYTLLGYTGVTASNLAAMNSSLENIGAAKVDTKLKLQTLIDTYNIILNEANGSASDATPTSDPTAAQYAAIGANIGAAASNSVTLSLLNDSIKGLSSTAIDSIAEINALAQASQAVIAAAAGTGAGSTTAPTLAQLSLMGVTGVTADNLAVVQNAIATTADSGLQVDTISELQALANNAISQMATSQTVIMNYAVNSSSTLPSLADFTKIAVTGVTASNLASINSAIDAKDGSGVDTAHEVQTLVTAYNKILAEANGTAADDTPASNPSSDDYQAIGAVTGLAVGGIVGGTDEHSAALSLLNSSIQGLTVTAVDTVGEINALATVVDQIIHLAMLTTGAATPADTPSMAQLSLLGIDTSLADTAAEQTDIWNAIIASADNGSGVSTLLALQALVTANAH